MNGIYPAAKFSHTSFLTVLLFFFFISSSSFGQASSIGKITSYKKIPGGIEGKTSVAKFDVRAYSDHIIRIRVTKNNEFNTVNYALADSRIPDFKNLNVTENNDNILLTTASIHIEIKKSSFLVTFKNQQGVVINEEVSGSGFGTSYVGDKVSVYKKMQEGERFLGLGEVLGNLDKRGMAFTLNNTDTYKYGDPRLSMYISIPFYIGLHHKEVYGIFYNNTYKSYFNFGVSTPGFSSVTMDGGDVDYFFFYDENMPRVLQHYAAVTGFMPLPPLWAIGYHQSRCSYYPQSQVKWIAETFRQKKIPIDCIVLDADYLHEYEPFRINKKRFPDMAGMASELAKMNIELTASVNPGIKIDSTYDAHLDGLKNDVFVKYSDGNLFVSDIAPSTNHFVDFTNPKSREWWIDHMKFLPDNGIHGYWNDMNEPAVGSSYLPDNLLFDFDGRKASALEAKNVFGFQMARSSFESALKYGKGRRPFVLTRSAFAGVQRYAAVWSGDNTAKDEGLLSGVLLNSQMSLSGLPFVGPDLGGYIGDGTKDLFRRWIQVGIFSPFVRNHKEFFATANEPWSYGEEVEAISKTFIGLRYRLMPYVYSKFYEASQTAMPIARSLALDYSFDDKVYDNLYQYEFLFGDAILVVPVTSQEAVKKIYLPEGDWYDLVSDTLIAGGKEWLQPVPSWQIPLFVKESSIIPMQQLVQSTKNKPADTLLLHVYNGKKKNTFVYYEDDGNSFDYKTGAFYKRAIEFDPASRQLKVNAQQGSFTTAFKYVQFIFHGFNNEMKIVNVNSVAQQIQNSRIRVLDPLENLYDYYDPGFYKQLRANEILQNQKTFVVPLSSTEIKLTW